MDLTTLVLGGAQVLTGLPVSIRAIQEIEGSQVRELLPDGRTWCLRFSDIACDMITGLQFLGDLSPAFTGAYWTWPLIRRTQARLVENNGPLLSCFLRIKVLGTEVVADKAADVALGIGGAAAAFPRVDWRWRRHGAEGFTDAMTTVTQSLVDYVALLRTEVFMTAGEEG